ncbi:hypothetical protein HYFRA_00011539 [Hymenoscyphus fraxineus]|uniref:Uncharacterized protein n=1 Tax=Hymenoscyphus fraxineus TaxID=746836 RepID=A0A9N9L708_9HELO|nr:hypothetical protein HYFRA_00011539 [Hymenoscyphus fraxineus]
MIPSVVYQHPGPCLQAPVITATAPSFYSQCTNVYVPTAVPAAVQAAVQAAVPAKPFAPQRSRTPALPPKHGFKVEPGAAAAVPAPAAVVKQSVSEPSRGTSIKPRGFSSSRCWARTSAYCRYANLGDHVLYNQSTVPSRAQLPAVAGSGGNSRPRVFPTIPEPTVKKTTANSRAKRGPKKASTKGAKPVGVKKPSTVEESSAVENSYVAPENLQAMCRIN